MAQTIASYEALHIVAIPYAGADRYAYRALQLASPISWKWTVLDLPGRGPRRKEARLRDIEDMVSDLHAQLTKAVDKEPYLLMGHSMGAILGYELMRRCLRDGVLMPKAAMLSSIAAPVIGRSRFISHLDKESFWKVIRSYNGVPEGIVSNPELRDYFEPVLRDDFAAIERYRPLNSGPVKLPVKLFIRAGNDEKIEEQDLLAWQEASSLPIDFARRSGDHFYLLKEAPTMISDITRANNGN